MHIKNSIQKAIENQNIKFYLHNNYPRLSFTKDNYKNPSLSYKLATALLN